VFDIKEVILYIGSQSGMKPEIKLVRIGGTVLFDIFIFELDQLGREKCGLTVVKCG